MKLSPGRQHAPALAALSAAALLVTLRSWIGKRWNALALYRGVERRPVCGSVSKLLSSTRRCHLRPSKQTSLYSVVSHGSCSRSAASKEAKPVVAVRPDMNIRYCARLFEQMGISHAPVIENEEILGIVSYYLLVLEGLPDLD